ncbi:MULTISPECIES: CYTH domain-containing protein [unclassified Virgibacillus]|uniref:CYTH domain-containing protein n=1 Tax=unclassified Virgibacillus TaxID=2620237 RepID=UPI0024DE0951|nr:CYTH domain-containing protein [Virgibacillus sp. LDC-1]
MAQEIEIEYKNLLTKEEFDRLLFAFPFPEQPIIQTNHYFETRNFALKDRQSALRIREKNGKYQLTLKEPAAEGLLETHDSLTKEEAEDWLKGNIRGQHHTAKQLVKLGISIDELVYHGSLVTARRECKYKDVLLVLDFSTYHGTSDYEFELEAPNAQIGQQAFDQILTHLNIEHRTTPNKIQRFFSTLRS